jgi:hypothetical protein
MQECKKLNMYLSPKEAIHIMHSQSGVEEEQMQTTYSYSVMHENIGI